MPTVATNPRQPHLLLLLAASFAIFMGGFALEETFSWTEPLDGFLNGIAHILIFWIPWTIVGLVPGLVIYGIYRWRGWRRFRSLAIVSPALVMFALSVINLIVSPTTPASRLKQTTDVDLPASARDIRTHFEGGGVTDYSDFYYFRCDPSDTDNLIQELGLEVAPSGYEERIFSERPFPPWPDPTTWEGSTPYLGDSEDEFWFYRLRTDSSRQQVYLSISCI